MLTYVHTVQLVKASVFALQIISGSTVYFHMHHMNTIVPSTFHTMTFFKL